MVLKYVHNSLTIFPQKVKTSPLDYGLTVEIHLLTVWCQVTSKAKLEKPIWSLPGSPPFGIPALGVLSQHIRSLATLKTYAGEILQKDYIEIEKMSEQPQLWDF